MVDVIDALTDVIESSTARKDLPEDKCEKECEKESEKEEKSKGKEKEVSPPRQGNRKSSLGKGKSPAKEKGDQEAQPSTPSERSAKKRKRGEDQEVEGETPKKPRVNENHGEVNRKLGSLSPSNGEVER